MLLPSEAVGSSLGFFCVVVIVVVILSRERNYVGFQVLEYASNKTFQTIIQAGNKQ